MVNIELTDQALTLRLNLWEKAAARRSHLTVPRRAVTTVRALPDAGAAVSTADAVRASGTFITGVTCAGTVTAPLSANAGPSAGASGCHETLVTFAMCHGTEPGVEILLDHPTVQRIVVSTPQAEDLLGEFEALA